MRSVKKSGKGVCLVDDCRCGSTVGERDGTGYLHPTRLLRRAMSETRFRLEPLDNSIVSPGWNTSSLILCLISLSVTHAVFVAKGISAAVWPPSETAFAIEQ